jgi:ABC-2 type transport system ATP-binding protein
LRKSFKDKLELDGIDLDIKEGTIFSLLGPLPGLLRQRD